jgi:ERCC4-related helicase
MTCSWQYSAGALDLAGSGRVETSVARRQELTAAEIVRRFRTQPGVILADEVGMGKTFVAFAVAASVIAQTRGQSGPVVVIVPSHMLAKWTDDWNRFVRYCIPDSGLRSFIAERTGQIEDVVELLRLLDDDPARKRVLVFARITTFTSDLKPKDKWIQLALAQKAFAKNPHLSPQRRSFERWAPYLLQMRTQGLTEQAVARLLDAHPEQWRRIIKDSGHPNHLDDDPIPACLSMRKQAGNFGELYKFLQQLPSSPRRVADRTITDQRQQFSLAARAAFKVVIREAEWHTPLMILDEAHHLKNPGTRAHSLFDDAESSRPGVDYLRDCFDRMLFLTATPFQLGHYELSNVIRLFLTVRWGHSEAPPPGREVIERKFDDLEQALDEAQRMARRLDERWGALKADALAGELDYEEAAAPPSMEELVTRWWSGGGNSGSSPLRKELGDLVALTRAQKEQAEALLRPWVIRHNRDRFFNYEARCARQPRRRFHYGRSILEPDLSDDSVADQQAEGIDVQGRAMLPFLLSVRAQSELARCSDRLRAYFAEGLASSYEAFHHTRQDGDASEIEDTESSTTDAAAIEEWYLRRIRQLVPGAKGPDTSSSGHPKIAATVRCAADLWEHGEKVLIFCFFIQTARALRVHLSNEIERRMVARAGDLLGVGTGDDEGKRKVWKTLEQISERCSRKKSPFHRVLQGFVGARIKSAFGNNGLLWLQDVEEAMIRFLRCYSYIARYYPLGEPSFRKAVVGGHRSDAVALEALRSALASSDATGMTLQQKVDDFLKFLYEKWDDQGKGERQPGSELDRYLDAFEKMQFRSRAGFHATRENFETEGSRRVLANVRAVTGEGMRLSQRETVMRAFNSPLFPEVLVASQVLAEGIDLHRACRFVIHHDLYWNPSIVEQRIGRVDRIQSKSELSRKPIHVFEPFISATADETMFRVLKDRERWFQVVMGEDFRLSDLGGDRVYSRLPLPASLASSLTFDLSLKTGKVTAADASADVGDSESSLPTAKATATGVD